MTFSIFIISLNIATSTKAFILVKIFATSHTFGFMSDKVCICADNKVRTHTKKSVDLLTVNNFHHNLDSTCSLTHKGHLATSKAWITKDDKPVTIILTLSV